MDDQQFRQFMDYCRLSWRVYRKVRKGVIERIRQPMGGMGCHNMAAYLIEPGINEDARHTYIIPLPLA